MQFRGSFLGSRLGLALLALVVVSATAFTLALPFRAKTNTYLAGNIRTPCLEVLNGQEHWARPFCEGETRIGNQRGRIQFNSEGIRDKEYPPRPELGVVRILFFGSSNVLGLGLEEPESIPRRLELELRAKGLRVEVINAAMVGYCTIQTSFRFQRLMERYSPQVVLFHFLPGNCPLFDGAWHNRVTWKDGAPISIDRSPFPGYSALSNFFFIRPKLFFPWLTAADQIKKALFSWHVYFAGDAEERAKAIIAPSMPYLNYMRKVTEQRGAVFFPVAYPMDGVMQSVPSQFDPRITSVLSKLIAPLNEPRMHPRQALAKSGFPLLFIRMWFSHYNISGDEHFTAQGAGIFAQNLAKLLAEKLAALRQ